MKLAAVDVLVLGAGWTSIFLVPALRRKNLTFACTNTSGTPKYDYKTPVDLIKWAFSTDLEPKDYEVLPEAKTIIITFPLRGHGQSKQLVQCYNESHSISNDKIPRLWIQLGSTGIYSQPSYTNHKSPYDTSNARAVAEDELLSLNGKDNISSAVLNLAGLWGDSRLPWNWVSKIADTREKLASKKALHLIHGDDVAAAIIACHNDHEEVKGQRWIITDEVAYDWWELIDSWLRNGKLSSTGFTDEKCAELQGWLEGCMSDEHVDSLPRKQQSLGRICDSREFWQTVVTTPKELIPDVRQIQITPEKLQSKA